MLGFRLQYDRTLARVRRPFTPPASLLECMEWDDDLQPPDDISDEDLLLSDCVWTVCATANTPEVLSFWLDDEDR